MTSSDPGQPADESPPWGDRVVSWLPDEVLGRRRRVRSFEPTLARLPEHPGKAFEPMSLQSIASLREAVLEAARRAQEAAERRARGEPDPEDNPDSEGLAPDEAGLDAQGLAGDEAIALGMAEPEDPVLQLARSEHEAALAAAREEGRRAGEAAGHARGLEEGRRQGRGEAEAALRESIEQEREALAAFMRSVAEAVDDTEALHRPLKSLALALASELVRDALGSPGPLIDRLVQSALREIDSHGGPGLVLTLSPADAAQYRNWMNRPEAPASHELRVREDAQLASGSIRLAVGETVVEDLIEHRFAAIAAGLGVEPLAMPPAPEVLAAPDET